MYEPTTFVRGPRNGNLLWRYMPLSRFTDLLNKRALFFARPEMWKDPYEGFYSEETREILGDKVPKYVITASERFARKSYCVSCWHMNQYESAAMWDLYGNEIAVQSSIGRIKRALKSEKRKVSLCRVEYQETARPLPLSLCQKRPSFGHEREVRLYLIEPDRLKNKNGTFVSVDLQELLERVHIAPDVDEPSVDSIKHLLCEHDLWHVPVVQSDLYSTDLH